MRNVLLWWAPLMPPDDRAEVVALARTSAARSWFAMCAHVDEGVGNWVLRRQRWPGKG